MTLRYWLLVPSIVLGCSGARYDNSQGPSMTMPARLAEGRNADAGAPQVEAGASMVSPPTPPNAQPDPVALKEPIQWEYVVEYDRGALRVVSAKRLDFKKPIPTARNMGRFAIELWIGRELIERVRFDFPLLGAEEPIGKRRPLKQPPTFAAGATVPEKAAGSGQPPSHTRCAGGSRDGQRDGAALAPGCAAAPAPGQFTARRLGCRCCS